jgi:PAS domain S-box-containing protein
MMTNERPKPDLAAELADLRLRLAEAEETLEAIRHGEADGFVIAGPQGPQVFTLQGAMEPYRLLIEQMSEGALTLSRDGVILYANQTFAAMLQLPPGRVIGAALRDFLPAVDQPAIAGLIETALNGSSSGEVSHRAAAGPTILLRLGLRRLQLGAETLICAVATDITVEKQREIESHRLAELLEARIAERTADLAVSRVAALNMMEEALEGRKAVEEANCGLALEIAERKQAEAELKVSQLELERKNAELERFLYTASHDSKSPVVTVRTFLGFLEQDLAAADAGKITKDMDFIRAAADKMGLLLDDVLDLARIGRVLSPPVKVTFRQLVGEVLATVAGRITERGVTVTQASGEVALFGDHLRLAETLQNLVDNACKFMGDEPAPLIEIGFEALAGETVFFVRDNGIGIDPRHQAKVFDLFEKLDPDAEGTGIGLALVKRIVEFYGGRIWVESKGAGQGTCFYFTLPGAVVPTKQGET